MPGLNPVTLETSVLGVMVSVMLVVRPVILTVCADPQEFALIDVVAIVIVASAT